MQRGILLACLAALLTALPARAAQVVALDLKATGNVPPRLAEALSPVLVSELSRREGMSVISQSDVRALLEHEAGRQLAGCSDTSCMTDIAGSLGAELLCSSSIGRVGAEYVVSIALIRVDGAKVARRSTGRARGGEEAASEALVAAVHELFKGELESELQGPASMTRRGFEASLAGLHRAVLGEGGEPKASRKRVILDLIQTELDYDVTPKIDMLDLALRRGQAEARRRVLASKSAEERENYLAAIEHYHALWDDLGRVKEIRERARERGVVPTARPLRFLDPDPMPRPERADVQRYLERSKDARAVVQRALAAYKKGDEAAFVALWKQGYEGNAKRELESDRESDKHSGYSYDLLPPFAMTPELERRVIDSLEKESLVVYKRRYKDGVVYDEDACYLQREEGRWVISSW
jgi:hypothetical protein